MKCILAIVFPIILSGSALAESDKPSACLLEIPKDPNLEEGKAIRTKIKDECIPYLQMVESCLSTASNLTSSVEQVKKLYFSESSSGLFLEENSTNSNEEKKFHLDKAFKQIVAKQRDVVSAVKELIADLDKFVKDPSTSGLDKVKKINRGYIGKTEKLNELSSYETVYLRLLDSSRSKLMQHLQNVESDLNKVTGSTCDSAKISPIALSSARVIKDVVMKVDMQHEQIVKFRIARSRLVSYIYQSFRDAARNQYIEETSADLNAIYEEILSTLKVNETSEKFNIWWLGVSKDNYRRSLRVNYLQWSEILRITLVDLQKARDFKEALRVASLDREEFLRPYLRSIDSVISQLEDEVSEAQDRGWEYYLSRQRRTAKKRVDRYRDRYSIECINGLEQFLKVSDNTTDIAEYLKLEKQYMKAVKSCVSK